MNPRRKLFSTAVLSALAVAPFSSSHAQTSDDSTWTYTPAFLPVSESGLSAVSAHGSIRLQQLIETGGTLPGQIDAPEYTLKPAGGGIDQGAVKGGDILQELMGSLPNILDLDFEIIGTQYRKGEQVVTIGQDGAIQVAFPERVERISIENLRVSDSESATLGDITMHDLSFHRDSRIRIHGE